MADGKGCTCNACYYHECGCDGVDWTPQELVDLRNQVALYAGRDKYLCDRIEAYEAIIDQERKSTRTWFTRADEAEVKLAALEKDALRAAEMWQNDSVVIEEMDAITLRILAATKKE
jgi:hypothetical protein